MLLKLWLLFLSDKSSSNKQKGVTRKRWRSCSPFLQMKPLYHLMTSMFYIYWWGGGQALAGTAGSMERTGDVSDVPSAIFLNKRSHSPAAVEPLIYSSVGWRGHMPGQFRESSSLKWTSSCSVQSGSQRTERGTERGKKTKKWNESASFAFRFYLQGGGCFWAW